MRANLEYRADIDGLRAVAVTAVIIYHVELPFLPGGFVGVDIFFVISGYLVTYLIYDDLVIGEFSFIKFYDRRIRRIIPALLFLLIVTSAISFTFLFPNDLLGFSKSLIASALSLSNIYFWRQSNYFAESAELRPLLHTWSLGVEEQFYIIFPIFLFILFNFFHKQWKLIIFTVFLTSLGLSAWGAFAKPAATFYLLPTRLWEFLVGSILALKFVSDPAKHWLRSVAGVAGLSAIGIAMVAYSSSIPFPGIAAILPCIGAGLVIWSGVGRHSQPNIVARFLRQPVLVFVGFISYSLYLWHWPLIAFTHYVVGPMYTLEKATVVGTTFILAVLSWHFIERPFRRRPPPWQAREYRFLFAGLCVISISVWGGITIYAQGFPARFSPEVLMYRQQRNDISPLRAECHADGRGKTEFDETCILGDEDGLQKIVVFADSHGVELSLAIAEEAMDRNSRVRQITASACPPSFDFATKERPGCPQHVEKMVSGLLLREHRTVILTAAYYHWNQAEFRKKFWHGFEEVARKIRMGGHSLVILGDIPPYDGESLPLDLAHWVQAGRPPKDYRFHYDMKTAERIDNRLRAIAVTSEAEYVPLTEIICDAKGSCRSVYNSSVLYFDKHHLTMSAARGIVYDVLKDILWGRN